MLAATAVVAALGAADSINPVTILVAVYLGSGPNPVRGLGGFIIGIFTVYLLGGLALMLGPAELLRADLATVAQVVLVVMFNVLYVLPWSSCSPPTSRSARAVMPCWPVRGAPWSGSPRRCWRRAPVRPG